MVVTNSSLLPIRCGPNLKTQDDNDWRCSKSTRHAPLTARYVCTHERSGGGGGSIMRAKGFSRQGMVGAHHCDNRGLPGTWPLVPHLEAAERARWTPSKGLLAVPQGRTYRQNTLES